MSAEPVDICGAAKSFGTTIKDLSLSAHCSLHSEFESERAGDAVL